MKDFLVPVTCAVLVAALAVVVPPPLLAQRDRSILEGVVTDLQGKAIGNATVRVRQADTGLERIVHTDAGGRYVLSSLPIGIYVVTVDKGGFQEVEVERVEQVLGATRTLNIRLQVGRAAERVLVTAALAQLETSQAAVGEALEQKQIEDLPLNGRNWSHLTAFVPGAVDTGSGDQKSIRFAGHGSDDTNFTLDGVDASGVSNQAHRQFVRLAIPLDSIAEFQVKTQNFNADTGETGGGQVSVASRAGSNVVHGAFFEYLRNAKFDARSPLDLGSPAPLVLNQFGTSVGGPIRSNRTFFFATYEGLRQRQGQTQIGTVPSASYRDQVLAQSPALAPILSAFPGGTSALSATVSNYIALAKRVDNEDSGSVRIDHRFSERTTGFVRFNGDETDYTIPTGALNALQNTDDKLKNGVAEVLHIFSPHVLTEFKFGVNQDQFHVATLSGVPFTVRISGFSALSPSSTTDNQGTSFNWLSDTTWIRGGHTIKFGGEWRQVRLNRGTSLNGTVTYTSLDNLTANRLDSATYTAVTPLKRLRKFKAFGYVQDEWKATSQLTVTAGVRYSFFNVLHEVDGRAIPFDLETCGGFCRLGSQFSYPRHNDFDPRLGLAWNRGATVLRVGAGIYHSDGQEEDQNLPYQNDVQRFTLNRSRRPTLRYPFTDFLGSTQGIVTPRDLYRNRKDFYISAWTASVQRILPANVVATLAYAGNKGTNVLTTTYQNVYDPRTGEVPYPQFGAIEFRKNDSNSTYHSLQASARKRFDKRLSVSANYTWSHSINDGGIGGGDSDVPQNVNCRACDKASSDFDVRHVVNITYVYELPSPGKRGWWSPLLRGWQSSGVITARSGLPVNVTVDRATDDLPNRYSAVGFERPDLVPGVSIEPVGGKRPTQWINQAAFATPQRGTFGNAGRNLVRGPNLWQVDTSVSRSIAVGERWRLQARAEAYNLLNRAQYGQPLANLSSPGNFGRITVPVNSGATGGGTPRQFQFAVRLSF